MKTFSDLKFETHHSAKYSPLYAGHTMAHLIFENGFGVSVVFGSRFYSNGVDTYELAVIKDGYIRYDTPITDDVLGHISEDEVTKVMERIQLEGHTWK